MSVHCLVEATARLDEPTREKHLPTPLMYSNVDAHAMRLTVVNNDGTPADLTDVAASATFLRSDNSTVEPILGEITGNVVEVILPGSCYTVPGRFEFSLNLAYGTELRTAMFVTGFVKKATSEEIIDPGTPVGNIDQVVAQAGAAATAAANAAASATSAAAAAQEVVDNVEDDIGDLKSAITGMTTATSEDEGKALIVKTVTNNKVTEWEFGATDKGLTDDIKEALLACFEHVAWANANGQTYYDALYDALYRIVRVYISPLSVAMVETGDMTQLTATTSPEGISVTWESSDTSVATVANGIVTAVASGICTITAKAEDAIASCSVYIGEDYVTSIDAEYTPTQMVYTHTSLDLLKNDIVVTATLSDSRTVVVESNDYTLSGTLSVGTSILTVSYAGCTDTISVTVTALSTYDYIGLAAGAPAAGNAGIIADIDADSTCYFETSFYYTDTSISNAQNLMGTRDGQYGSMWFGYFVTPSTGKLGFWANTKDTTVEITSLLPNAINTVKMQPIGASLDHPDSITLIVNNTEYDTNIKEGTHEYSPWLGLFAYGTSATTTNATQVKNYGQRIGTTIIKDANMNVIHNLVPASDGTNKGFLDTVTGNFYFNANYNSRYECGNWT